MKGQPFATFHLLLVKDHTTMALLPEIAILRDPLKSIAMLSVT